MSLIVQNKTIKFTIDHLDPKGQGVFKQDGQIYFIPRTLPQESGEALVYHEHKNLHFAIPQIIYKSSPERRESSCPHFDQCGGCNYLHTDYTSELSFKKKTLKFLLKKLNPPEILVEGAEQRTHYRNRIQLHYDLNAFKLGFWSIKQDEIIEIPHCLILEPKLAQTLKALYQDKSWMKLVKANTHEVRGHLELYLKQGEVSIAVNQAYAHLGFTQVHEKMNLRLKEIVKKEYINLGSTHHKIFDLFGGSGNLSRDLPASECLVIDSFDNNFPSSDHQNFLSLNLYQKDAARKLASMSGEKNFLILDPPRSGLKNISEFLSVLNVETFFYISCDPHTFCRDLDSIKTNYHIAKLYLLDLFPSTYHFECFAVIQRRQNS